MGGGQPNTISIWTEFAPMLEKLVGHKLDITVGDWRPGDQKVYVSDIGKAQRELGWKPKVTVREGVQRLFDWVSANKSLFK